MRVVCIDEVRNSGDTRIEERLRLKGERVLAAGELLHQYLAGTPEHIIRSVHVATQASTTDARGWPKLVGHGQHDSRHVSLANDVQVPQVDDGRLQVGESSLKLPQNLIIRMG